MKTWKSVKLSGDLTLSLITGFCILTLAIISKYALDVPLNFISLYGPTWVYITYLITQDKEKKREVHGIHLCWGLSIIIVTVAILIIHITGTT